MLSKNLITAMLASTLIGAAGLGIAVTPNSISIDGNCADWSSDEKFVANDSAEVWTTWDDNNLYFAWWGGGAGANPNSHRRIVAIDLSPNVADTTASMTYSGVQFPPKGIADYIVEFNNLQVWFTYRTGDIYTTVINPPGTANFFNPNGCAGVNFAEIRVPRNLFTTGTLTGIGTTQPLSMTGYFFDPGANFVYGSMPQVVNGSGTANQNFTNAIHFPTTDSGRSPNPYGSSTNFVPVSLSRWGVE
jgi:hypothetical protein